MTPVADKKPPEVLRLLVANGVLLEAPIWEQHYRGSNWMAVIDLDPMSPGGLSRKWLSRGKGECLYVLDQLTLFDPIEFGADYTTCAGTKKRDRWYGVVTAITEGFLLIERCSSGAKAVVRSKLARTSPSDRAAALGVERDVLVAKAAKLEGEIAELLSPETGPVEAGEVPAPAPEPPNEGEPEAPDHG